MELSTGDGMNSWLIKNVVGVVYTSKRDRKLTFEMISFSVTERSLEFNKISGSGGSIRAVLFSSVLLLTPSDYNSQQQWMA